MTAANAATQRPRSDRAATLCSLAMLAAAFAWFWPTLQHGLRSDDYLACYYMDRLTGDVHWGRVFEEFVRPWFGVGELYRPMVSVSTGVELWLFPSPAGRHAFNVLFVAVAAAATAATAALLVPQRAALAACVAGAVVVLHPGAVETAAWISARVTSLQMAACALSCWLFARHLARGRPLWPSVLLHVVALATKEGAMTLPVTLLALDWLHAPAVPWRDRLRRLLPFAAVTVLYFAWRLLVLGRLGPMDASFDPANAANVAIRTGQLFVPPDGAGSVMVWALAPLLLAIAPLWQRAGALVLVVPVWFFAVLSPTQHLRADFATLYGRFVFDAVPGLGIVLALAVAGAAGRTWLVAAGLAAATWLAAMAATSTHWLERFATEDRLARGAERAVVDAAAGAAPERPSACTWLPYLPMFHQKLWGVLALQPFAPRDLAVVGLPDMLVRDANAPEFFNDGAPLHAVLAAGGRMLNLDFATLQFGPVPRAPAATLPLSPAAGNEFVVGPGRAWPGTSVASIEVRVPAPSASVRLRLLADPDDERSFGWQQQTARDGAAWFLTAHAVVPMLLECAGVPFRGIRLEVDGQAPPPGTAVTVHAALARRPLPQRCAGALRTRGELHDLARTPPFAERSRLYVMLPTGARWMDVPPGGADLSPALREHLRWALDIFAPLTVHWFWQSPRDGEGQPWCSELDWANAR